MRGECNNCGDDHTEGVCHEIRANELELINADLVAEITKLKQRLELAEAVCEDALDCYESRKVWRLFDVEKLKAWQAHVKDTELSPK